MGRLVGRYLFWIITDPELVPNRLPGNITTKAAGDAAKNATSNAANASTNNWNYATNCCTERCAAGNATYGARRSAGSIYFTACGDTKRGGLFRVSR